MRVLVVVSFRSRCTRIFNVMAEEQIYEDKTAKSCGTFVTTSPSILPGFVSYDTGLINMDDIQYTCTVYVTFDDANAACNTSVVMPLFNK